jgi:hypothetical protein
MKQAAPELQMSWEEAQDLRESRGLAAVFLGGLSLPEEVLASLTIDDLDELPDPLKWPHDQRLRWTVCAGVLCSRPALQRCLNGEVLTRISDTLGSDVLDTALWTEPSGDLNQVDKADWPWRMRPTPAPHEWFAVLASRGVLVALTAWLRSSQVRGASEDSNAMRRGTLARAIGLRCRVRGDDISHWHWSPPDAVLQAVSQRTTTWIAGGMK